jgi:hypothetical protein
LVRNTRRRPSAETRKEWAVPGMHMWRARLCMIGELVDAEEAKRWTSDTNSDQAATDRTGLRISRSTLLCGKLCTLYSQSDAAWRLLRGSAVADAAVLWWCPSLPLLLRTLHPLRPLLSMSSSDDDEKRLCKRVLPPLWC